MAAHVAATQKHFIKMVDDEGQPLWVMTKERHDSEKKIDGAMAGGLSWQAFLDATAAGLVVDEQPAYAYFV